MSNDQQSLVKPVHPTTLSEMSEEVGEEVIAELQPAETDQKEETVPRIVGSEGQGKPIMGEVPKSEANNKGGAPCLWKPEYNEQIEQYFDKEAFDVKEVVTTGAKDYHKVDYKVIPEKLPTFERFAHSIGVDADTLRNWADMDESDIANKVPEDQRRCPGFFGSYTRAKKLQKAILVEGGLAGAYQGNFAIFVAKNFTDMKDRSEVDHDPDGVLQDAVERIKKNFPD